MLFIFDMGGVVTRNASPEARIASTLGVSAEEFRAAQNTAEGENLFSLLTRGMISENEFWNEVGTKLGRQIETNLWQFFFHPKMDSRVKKTILSLRKKKHRVVCGTNTIESHWQNHVARGDYAIFDETYASQKIALEKPDAEFWKTILLSEGYSPGETFFTDDREENVEAARAIGIESHKFENAPALKKAIGEFLKRKKNSRQAV